MTSNAIDGRAFGSMTSEEGRGQSRTALISIGAAVVLVALKLGTGLVTGSLGLVSAGIESSGDVIAAVLTFFAIRLGTRPADAGHPYGHRRAENLASLGEAAVLVGGGTFVLVEAIGSLRRGGDSLSATWPLFVVLAIALLVDVSRTLTSLRSARRYRSAALRSNAFHFAADFSGTLAVAIGLLLVRLGVGWGDAAAALVVAVIIFAAAARLAWENTGVLMDRAPVAAEQAAREAIGELDANLELQRLRLRESGGRYFTDVVVAVPPGQPVVSSHALSDQIEHAIERALPGSDVVVHVEPQRRSDLRDRILAAALVETAVREAHDITIFDHPDGALLSLHLKFPAELSLAKAHEISERVEAAIRANPGVLDVQTHLEPLERPVAVDPSAAIDEQLATRIRALAEAHRRPAAARANTAHARRPRGLPHRADPPDGHPHRRPHGREPTRGRHPQSRTDHRRHRRPYRTSQPTGEQPFKRPTVNMVNPTKAIVVGCAERWYRFAAGLRYQANRGTCAGSLGGEVRATASSDPAGAPSTPPSAWSWNPIEASDRMNGRPARLRHDAWAVTGAGQPTTRTQGHRDFTWPARGPSTTAASRQPARPPRYSVRICSHASGELS
jgi:cation diffusion facilitator family transporter